MNRFRHACTTFLLLLVIWATPGSVFATPFDAIVPSKVEIGTSGNLGVLFNWWGWIVATTDIISLTDLQNASFTAQIDDPFVSVLLVDDPFLNPTFFAPLSPTEVAGWRNVPFNSTAYDPLLMGGESLKNPGIDFWHFDFFYPNGHTGTATLTASVSIMDDVVNYTSQVSFGDFGATVRITEGQRLSATPISEPIPEPIPEPTTMALLGIGLFGLAGRAVRRRFKRVRK